MLTETREPGSFNGTIAIPGARSEDTYERLTIGIDAGDKNVLDNSAWREPRYDALENAAFDRRINAFHFSTPLADMLRSVRYLP